jgi:hypothetical protein
MVLSKLEQRARQAKTKELLVALRRRRVGTGWRLSSNFLFREHTGWFFSVVFAIWPSEPRTVAKLYVKPMALDPLFWKIVETEENINTPLSFRHNGAWTCSTPVFSQIEFDDSLEPELLAASILEWSHQQLQATADHSVDDFVSFIQAAPRGYPEAFFASEVIGLILQGKLNAAKARCGEAKARKSDGGFVWGPHGAKISLVDGVESWLARNEN